MLIMVRQLLDCKVKKKTGYKWSKNYLQYGKNLEKLIFLTVSRKTNKLYVEMFSYPR